MRSSGKKRQLPAAVYFIIILVIMTAASLTALWFYQKMNHDAVLSSNMISAANQIDTQKRLMLSNFRTVKSDLMFLPHLNEFLRFKEQGQDEDRRMIEKEFLEFITYSGLYDQIRYIDKSGMEITRANYNNGEPAPTPPDELQDKRNRYYFSETISLDEKSIYISPFDLNIEHGRIEEPLKPMIRFGTPVFNQKGDITGVIILNFLGQILLDELVEATAAQTGTFSLMNSDGYWLYNNDPETEWAFMYSDKNEINMKTMTPALWKRISTEKDTQFIINETLYTSTIVKPLENEKNITNTRHYVLLNTIPFKDIKIDKETERRNLLRIMTIILRHCRNPVLPVFHPYRST